MGTRPSPSYGTPNWDLIGRWLELAPEDDGAFWALNLMKYHAVADYRDGSEGGPRVSGREADDAYAPVGPLAAVGAMVAFLGDVVEQPLGQPAWDRIGIVRYPSRAAFFAMQQRDDFKAQHVHKEAGMDFTIVMSCLPVAHDGGSLTAGRLVLLVERGAARIEWQNDGISSVAAFAVEGVIVGDERSFDHVRLLRVANEDALTALVGASASAEEAHVVVVDPAIDRLVQTVVTAAPSGDGQGGA